ncbi:carbohydrate ABC transporter permease [Amorphoplanes digitatis]|uniref:Multiple sugar transport system permease protein n=1 Tax=Actinoplanes digitatis TaxID=1868 RepID=A0A7W7HYB1_9ACTN|nr:sugar ABC transporter permease [Actinoplanes digitatis]MBB4763015.1 multiple sugar transport system permease protein [Actinoplanes digitatis]BFE71994.1 sugar ABC transporter permease [Actinoplanes digitatis]GID95784.1 sugar ABC transporter permease [Actinoplanes digitatis]
MYRGWRRRWLGLLYLSPALLFVLAFTVLPLAQMGWMSLHNWSLISPPTWVGLDNYTRAFHDRQFWVSFRFTLEYTLLITPILIIGGYLLALLTSGDTMMRRFTRTVLFTPVVIGLGVSSLLWYWLFSTDFGPINALLRDAGVIGEPVVWLGVDADRSLIAITASVVWKVIGFGMVLFIGAIQAIPTEITEASVVDGAGFRQRVTRIILPLTLRTVLLVTLLSVVGSLLAFDQFYIMTAGQPQNQTSTSVFFVYLNSFPYLKLGYGAALSMVLALTILAFTVLQLLLARRSHS